MKTIFFISRIFVGLVFVFSGFVKAIDPVGFAIKFEEYFEAFHLGFLTTSALPLAIAVSATELMLGLNLLAGIRWKITTWLLLIMITFFTLLTFVLALTNPVSDCGCFGDAVKLTNWQTFWKNIVLLVPSLIIFFNHGKFNHFYTPRLEWMLLAINYLIPCTLSVYCIIHKPFLDFRPYKTGAYLPEKMAIPDGAPVDEYETILVYEKDGVRKSFTEKNFPWQDTTWKWVETQQKLISKGYEPPIHDFSITSADGNDITDQVLSDNGYTLLVIVPNLEKTSEKGLQKVNDLALRSLELGITVLGLTSSTDKQINAFRERQHPDYDICTTDETALQTIIRANPGIMLLREGTVLGKWNYHEMPDVNELQSNMLQVVLNENRRITELLTVLALVMGILLVYCIMFTIIRINYSRQVAP
jgi:uncharacterized membrane protein YphA (DoxX/SURF4 family)